jgi:hypothetical protein
LELAYSNKHKKNTKNAKNGTFITLVVFGYGFSFRFPLQKEKYVDQIRENA